MLAALLVTVQPALAATAAYELPPNRLGDHPSPYLASHAGDHVRWQAWDEDAFAAARESGRLLFVSVGYHACYWCHVIQRESYQHADTAALLNETLVPVKVDRELRPALDAHLMRFVESTTGRAGWPLHVLVTPDGHPLLGFTYLPRDELTRIVSAVTRRWQSDSPRLAVMAERADRELRQRHAVTPTEPLRDDAIRAVRTTLLAQIMDVADPLSGGFGDQAKFPSVAQLDALLDAEELAPDPERRAFLDLTLANMATQGLRDQLGGGFFRYVTDPQWLVPHFEKMLYDNAVLARLYARASDVLAVPALGAVAADTLAFMRTEMWHPDGGFIASLSADDAEGREGTWYLITDAMLDAHLSPEEARAARLGWGLQGNSQFTEGYLPRQAATPPEIAAELGLDETTVRAHLQTAREALHRARFAETLPRDTKRLAGWNGLALSALAAGSAVLDDPSLRDTGDRVARLLADELWDGRSLARARTPTDRIGATSLQDYAFVAEGLVDWAALTGEPRWNETAARVVERAWDVFHEAGGFAMAERDVIALTEPAAAIADRAMPSPSAALIRATFALPDGLLAPAIVDTARTASRTLPTSALDNPFFYSSHVRVAVGTLSP